MKKVRDQIATAQKQAHCFSPPRNRTAEREGNVQSKESEMMYGRLVLSAIFTLALGDFLLRHGVTAAPFAPSGSAAPTRDETYVPTRANRSAVLRADNERTSEFFAERWRRSDDVQNRRSARLERDPHSQHRSATRRRSAKTQRHSWVARSRILPDRTMIGECSCRAAIGRRGRNFPDLEGAIPRAVRNSARK